MLIAILNEAGGLIGTREGEPADGDVPLPDGCDLPLDGSYKWMAEHGAFVPLGHGFPRMPSKPPVSAEFVLYQIAKAMKDDLPDSVHEWMDHFAQYHEPREVEGRHARRARKARGR